MSFDSGLSEKTFLGFWVNFKAFASKSLNEKTNVFLQGCKP